MPALDYQLFEGDNSHWITVYYHPGIPELSGKDYCGYTCPTLEKDGTHRCKVFGVELETRSAPAGDGNGEITIARRCNECRTARQESW